jgi:hypothetical protein
LREIRGEDGVALERNSHGSKVAAAVPDTISLFSSDLMLLSAATKSSLAEVLGLVQKTVLNAVYILLRLFISLIPYPGVRT